MMNYYEPFKEEKIPHKQGIYAFYINAVTKQKLGLLGKGPFSEQQLETARKLLISKLQKVMKLSMLNKLQGKITEEKKVLPGISLALYGFEIEDQSLIDYVVKCDSSVLVSMIEMLDHTSLFNRPIYCGIAKEQTLKARYLQHRYNFENCVSEKSFGGRFSKLGFDWDDLVFGCAPFSGASDQFEVLNHVEKYLMQLSKPYLSIY